MVDDKPNGLAHPRGGEPANETMYCSYDSKFIRDRWNDGNEATLQTSALRQAWLLEQEWGEEAREDIELVTREAKRIKQIAVSSCDVRKYVSAETTRHIGRWESRSRPLRISDRKIAHVIWKQKGSTILTFQGLTTNKSGGRGWTIMSGTWNLSPMAGFSRGKEPEGRRQWD
jgi:hypothetical protein